MPKTSKTLPLEVGIFLSHQVWGIEGLSPEGKTMLPGLYYNPYFAGGAIAMEKQLNDGQLEYEDGTEATASQLAKDVTTFLAWAAEPEHDERKLMGIKWMLAMLAMVGITGFYKRLRWSVLKTRKVSYLD